MSTDKDFLQLIDDRVKVWSPTKKKLYNKQQVLEEFGIPSRNMLTYRILDGDKSDNINGVKVLWFEIFNKIHSTTYRR